MRIRMLVATLLALTLIAAACGELNDDWGLPRRRSGGDDLAIDHPTGANDLILRLE